MKQLFTGSVFDSDEGKDRDFAQAFGQAEIEGFGRFNFTRQGDVIFVSGLVDMRFDETFDFERGILGSIGTALTVGAPTVSNSDLRDLATFGSARPFTTTSRRLWQVTGRIVLQEGGMPDPNKTKLFWSDADWEEAAQ